MFVCIYFGMLFFFFFNLSMSVLQYISHYYSYKWDKDGYLFHTHPPTDLKM